MVKNYFFVPLFVQEGRRSGKRFILREWLIKRQYINILNMYKYVKMLLFFYVEWMV